VKVETWLDEGMGSCVLRDQTCAGFVTQAMHHFDGERYELEVLLKSWKQFGSTNIHRRIGGSGSLWQEESYDRIIRDEEHLFHCLQYIGANPRKAGLSPDACPLWIRPEWVALGWSFDPPT
jgi:putative transposase